MTAQVEIVGHKLGVTFARKYNGRRLLDTPMAEAQLDPKRPRTAHDPAVVC